MHFSSKQERVVVQQMGGCLTINLILVCPFFQLELIMHNGTKREILSEINHLFFSGKIRFFSCRAACPLVACFIKALKLTNLGIERPLQTVTYFVPKRETMDFGQNSAFCPIVNFHEYLKYPIPMTHDEMCAFTPKRPMVSQGLPRP